MYKNVYFFLQKWTQNRSYDINKVKAKEENQNIMNMGT